MNQTVLEIARYCREENTFGALLFCGEWGSGKTHLMEYDLPEVLGDSFTILRISLFGEESLDGIRKKVLAAWQDRLADLTEDPSALPREARRPGPELAGRRLILAFDDLERTNLSQVELLGCINEYCENLHIKTIIIANEEKIENRQAANRSEGRQAYTAYAEMKEKLIARTIRLRMDDTAVIRSIVAQYRTPLEEYRRFLQDNQEELISLLEDCELHNIRSLRCGLQDFEQIFAWARGEALPEEELARCFSSFVLFTMLAKNGRISRSSLYGYGLNRLQQKYGRHYDDRSLPDCLKDGIMTGDWAEEHIRAQFRKRKEFLKGSLLPENRIRTTPFQELDDDTVQAGWQRYLEMAYHGFPEPAEYIHLLRHLLEAGQAGYRFPEQPQQRLLRQGLADSVEQLLKAGHLPEPAGEPLTEAELSSCTEEETALYQEILRCLNGRELQYREDYAGLLAACRSGSEEALYRCRRAVITRWDEPLAKAIADHYRTLSDNRARADFSVLILRILAQSEKELPPEEGNRDGLLLLAESLKKEEKRQTEAGRPLATLAARRFREGLS